METLGQLTAHLVLDLAAVSVLTFAIYYPRHSAAIWCPPTWR